MKKKLLFVDDMKRVHERSLPDFNKKYEVDSAFTKQDALNKINQNKYNLIITDYNLEKGGEGIDIIKSAKGRGFRVVMMSKSNHREEALKAGANGFLFKKNMYKHISKYIS